MAKKKGNPQKSSDRQALPFEAKNYTLMLIGVVSVIIGFVLMANKNISLSALFLVFGYCIAIPLGIFLKGDEEEPS